MKKRLYIIDGNALLHRAWHAIPPLTIKDGTVVNAVYGFAMVIDKLLMTEKPTHLVVCWDVAGGTFRDEIFEDYKATRERKEDELYSQIDLIDEILAAHNIPSFGLEGFEADDLIGTIAEKVRKNDDVETKIVTGDLDSLQLVDESTEILFFVKGLSQTKTYNIDAVKQRYGFGPEHIVDYKALRGDTSDNIPGVRGVGDKTATTLIQEFGGIDGIYKAVKDGSIKNIVKPGVVKKLSDGKESAEMSYTLATIVRDVPMTFSMKEAEVSEPNWEEVKRLYRLFEFNTLLRRIEEKGEVASENREVRSEKKKKQDISIDRDGSKVDEALDALKTGKLAVDIWEHAPDLFGSTITALCFSNGSKTYVFATPANDTVSLLSTLLENRDLVTFDLKALQKALAARNIEVSETGTDLQVASYLVRAGSRSLDRESVLIDLLEEDLRLPKALSTHKELLEWGELVSHYVAAATEARSRLKETNMTDLFDDIEQPLISVLARMERKGITLAPKTLEEMSHKMEKTITELQKKIWKAAGREFNISSPSQLAIVLFEDLELPTKSIKKTKSGYSTAASELDKIRDLHPIVDMISEYREVTKLKSTYVDTLPTLVASDGRVHTTFDQTVAATGRLSSRDPNVQNIPIRTALGREVRKAFVAPKGSKLVAADYSQIELRLVAAFSGDKEMVKIFKSGGDIHRATAAKVFGIEEDMVTKSQRRAAKAVNFGLIYGMGPRALSRSIDVSFQEAKEFIEKYFEVFPGVRKYLDDALKTAQKNGYAKSILDRRRYLPDLESGVPMVRAGAERMAINMPLQGSSADIIKQAMIEIDAWIAKDYPNGEVKMILQVHDELVFEVKDELVQEVSSEVKKRMEGAVKLEVPIIVDVEVGQNWKEMK